MDSPTRSTPTSASRALYRLLILGAIVAFGCGWFVRQSRAVVLDYKEFPKALREAKKKALSQFVPAAPWYAAEYYLALEEDHVDHIHHQTILITPSMEYFDELKVCIMNYMDSFGTVREIGDGRLELCPRFIEDRGPTKCWMASVIRWGDRQYLVRDASLANFMKAVATGMEPRSKAYGNYYMRKGDWEKPVTSSPQIPQAD